MIVINDLVLVGRVAREPELRYNKDNLPMAIFDIAVDRPTRDKETKKYGEKSVDFFRLTAFGKTAENCKKYLGKGKFVAVQARLHNNSYTDKNGEKKFRNEIHVYAIQFIEWKDSERKSKKDEYMLPEGFDIDESDDSDFE